MNTPPKDPADLARHPNARAILAAALGAAPAPRADQATGERETKHHDHPEATMNGPIVNHVDTPQVVPQHPPAGCVDPRTASLLFAGPPDRGILADDPPPFPVEVLPRWLGRWVSATARVKAVRTDIPGALALGVASCAAAWTPEGMGRILVADGSMVEPLNLYCVAVEESGSNKSGILRPALAPLRELAQELVEAARPERAAREAVRVTLQVEVDALTDQIKARAKAAKSGKANEWKGKDPDTLREELADAKQALDAAPRATDPTLIESDTTPEALATALADNPALCLATSEGNEVFALITGRYGNGPNLDLMLKAWDGETTSIRRKTSGRIVIERPTLAWAIAVQPVTVRKLGKFDGDLNERGLVGRILFAWPNTVMGTRCPPSDDWVGAEVTEDYRAGIRALFEAVPDMDGDGKAPPIALGPEARELAAVFYRETEAHLANGARFAWCRSMVSKMRSQALRLAGLLHLASGWRQHEPVNADTMRAALTLAEYFLAMGLRTWGAIVDGDEPPTVKLWDVLKARATDTAIPYTDPRNPPGPSGSEDLCTLRGISERALWQVVRRSFDDMDAMRATVRELASAGYVAIVPQPRRPDRRGGNSGQNPSPWIVLNPEADR